MSSLLPTGGSPKRACDAIISAMITSESEHTTLSAIGCGAFGHPPAEVARVFKEQLAHYPTPRISFAIIDDHNAYKAHNREGNVTPFKRILDNHSQVEDKW